MLLFWGGKWMRIQPGLVRSGRFFSQRLQGFFATTPVCVFFTACQQKRGLLWCLFLLYQPTYADKGQIARWCLNVRRRFLPNALKIPLKTLLFYARFHFAKQGYSRCPLGVYHITTRLAKPQKGSAPRNVLHERFHAFSAPRLFEYV